MTERSQINRRAVLDTQGGRAYLLRRYLAGEKLKSMGAEFWFKSGESIAFRLRWFVKSMMSDEELDRYHHSGLTSIPTAALSQSLRRWCENPDHPLQPYYAGK